MEIERYEYPVIELLLDNKFVMFLFNDVELGRVQLNISENRLEGYSIRWDGKNTSINTKGELDEWFTGMHDEMSRTYSKLFESRKDFVKRFYYESNACWGEVEYVENLKEKVFLQISEVGNPIDTIDDFFDMSKQSIIHEENFGTRKEHGNKKTLREFLTEHNFNFKRFYKLCKDI